MFLGCLPCPSCAVFLPYYPREEGLIQFPCPHLPPSPLNPTGLGGCAFFFPMDLPILPSACHLWRMAFPCIPCPLGAPFPSLVIFTHKPPFLPPSIPPPHPLTLGEEDGLDVLPAVPTPIHLLHLPFITTPTPFTTHLDDLTHLTIHLSLTWIET